MSQLIKLNVSKRNNKKLTAITPYGLDVEDIVVPIRQVPGQSISYFTSRARKLIDRYLTGNVRVDFEVIHTLDAIVAKSPKRLVKLTVVSRKDQDFNNEKMVFRRDLITDEIVTTDEGSKFLYVEDGEAEPVDYIVQESIDVIVTETEICECGEGVVELSYVDDVSEEFIFDASAGNLAILTLIKNSNLTIINPTAGREYYVKIVQDAVGGYSLGIPSNCIVQGNGSGSISLTGTPNSVDYLTLVYDGTKFITRITKNHT